MNRKFLLAAAFVLPAGLLVAQETGHEAASAMMKANGGALKTLGDMAKGTTAFDAEAANAALEKLAANAAEIPAVFETPYEAATASPDIWTNWDDFVAKSEAMVTAASVTVDSAEAIGPVLGAIGGTCGACHQPYRLKE